MAIPVVKEMNLSMKKGKIFHLGKHDGEEENEGSLNTSSYSIKEMYFIVNWALEFANMCGHSLNLDWFFFLKSWI